MPAASATGLKARKTPRQARSAATLEAIFAATVQVLLDDGASRLTTTRVAERAGVSVGTMYQYFPHKQSLLHAVLAQHLDAVATAIEARCEQVRGRKLAEISDGLAEAFVGAKAERLDLSRALYRMAPDLDAASLNAAVSKRMAKAVGAVLASASDARFDDVRPIVQVLMAAVSGATRAALESDAPAQQVKTLAVELPRLCRAYLLTSAKLKRSART